MYLYESHLGGYFTSDEELEDTYCETCGDSDWLIAEYETDWELWQLLKSDCSINGSGGYCLDIVAADLLGGDRKDYDKLTDNQIVRLINKTLRPKIEKEN